MLLYFISGYGMTKGIIDATLATKLHINILTYIILVAFIIHPLFAIHLALKRWQIWNTGTKILLFGFFITFISLFVYVDRYYQPKAAASTVSSSVNQSNSSSDDENDDDIASTANVNQNINSANSNSSTQIKTFTLSELAKYDGQNGNPAYLAVDGNVYDLTSVFKNGSHFSHYAGKELTNAFYSYHAKSALAKYSIIGTLVK